MERIITVQDEYIKDYRKKIGSQVKESRETKGYTQDDLAEMLNVNRSTISKIERGKFAFTIDFLAKLSWYLKFELDNIFTDK
ncbi:MAG: helix-turn-helix transcriptional regulator [Ignavibacteriaceae bacterium]|jgi:DNA-binding XRE family transcriptional regulator